jgi:hypothetical protein
VLISHISTLTRPRYQVPYSVDFDFDRRIAVTGTLLATA